MTIKKILWIITIVFLAGLVLRSCINADIPQKYEIVSPDKQNNEQEYKPSAIFKNQYINGIDYRVSRGEAGKYGGTLYSSTIGEGPKTFNPWNSKDATSSEFGALMFDGLTSTDAYTGEVIPLMAKSVEVDKSGMVYTVKLRRGLKWSDGKPITSADVAFTWNDIVIAGYGNTSMLDSIIVDGKPPKIEAVDDLTVKFTTPKPFAPFLRQLSTNIAPKHILEPVVKKGKNAFNSFWGVTTRPDKFVTSGMFRLAEYVPAQRVKFVRNPNYYMIDKKGKKLPYLDNYVVYIVGDLNNQLLKFEAGEIDILGIRGAQAAKFKEKEKNSNYKLYNLGSDTGTTFLAFNLNTRKNPEGKYYVNPIKQRWFSDINFRTAIDYVLDRESIVMNIINGVGQPLFTAEGLSSIFLNKTVANGHKRNIEKARELLKKSGFYLDKKGWLSDKYGNKVEFNLYTNAGNTEREAIGVMAKQDIEELGIKVNFKPVEFNTLVGRLMNTYDWDMVLLGLTGSPLEPHGGINVWNSRGTMHLFNMGAEKDNETNLWERELDKIFERGALEMNFEKRKKIYNRYQEIIYDKKPVLYLYSPLSITAVRNRVGNICPTPLGGVLHNTEEIYIK
jgi:peptide/nickel transport system substrate-binding protein